MVCSSFWIICGSVHSKCWNSKICSGPRATRADGSSSLVIESKVWFTSWDFVLYGLM